MRKSELTREKQRLLWEVLFGVNDIEELKGKIEKCVYNSEISYLRGWDAAPTILNYIKVEDIGTLN